MAGPRKPTLIFASDTYQRCMSTFELVGIFLHVQLGESELMKTISKLVSRCSVTHSGLKTKFQALEFNVLKMDKMTA